MNDSAAAVRSLSSMAPFITAANVRGTIETASYSVAPGTGKIGDLVLGVVRPPRDKSIVVLDQSWTAHTVSEPQRVLAVLGPRDSSTHVCAVIPADGVNIENGTRMHWVAGESGIVGCLERQPPAESVHTVESAIEFVCDGLLVDAAQQVINIIQFAAKPNRTSISVPIVMVAATSSESGKTVLAGEIISRLTGAGVRVGAVKVTGTGGVLDSSHHKQSGAVAVLDNVDAGFISTAYCTADEFRRRIPKIFQDIGESDVDVIIAELGGDLLCANNPEVFRIDEIVNGTRLLLVISNDALAAAGVVALNESRFRFPSEKIRHFTSPFRNHAGMARRMALAGVQRCWDPRSPVDLRNIVSEIVDSIAPTA